jgi:transcriptional regulator with XRE-family HTH domain
MKENGMTIADVANAANLPSETVRNLAYENRVSDPKASTALAISKVFKVSVNYLFDEPFIEPDEVELVGNYRDCSVHGKNRIDMIARYEAATGDEWDEHGRRKIPCSVPPQIDVRKGIMYDSCDTVYIWTSLDEAELAIEMVGFPREIFRNYGTYAEKMEYYGLTQKEISEKLEKLISL